ncbi:PLP-dependent aminotransferase family protein [Amycolatopsis sp. EV170708-02-1]|uniref:aminotransferase-like domain-containing protein n=1 Tax=Amycolatopsis sp. EV170708-02-1 TaxID=2919322 RepID=UPI001F0C5241|nr:PLP-dependent aminotransferase family protein [Amycolatopsis sp. EV170708-02-1]UMP06869.1 PLP-dependent aminotransferase family protein [Amycolatopsis sp. EV170708-02-1]
MSGVISFERGNPSLDLVDVEGITEASRAVLANDPERALGYSSPCGYTPLREWLAKRHGVPAEQVLITNGSMQALDLIFDLLLRPGAEALIEVPTFHYTLASLRSRDVHLRGIPVSAAGMDPAAVQARLGLDWRPALAVVTPNFQNPTGCLMSATDRMKFAEMAAKHDFFLVEDDPYRDLVFAGNVPPAIREFNFASKVIYLSSFSKTIAPGLRCGYIIAPESVIEGISRIANLSYVSPGVFSQAIIYHYCVSGRSEEWLTKVRGSLRCRRDTLVDAITKELPGARCTRPGGGFYVWVEIPGVNVRALARSATTHGVAVMAGPEFMLEGGETALRLSYAPLDCGRLSEGVTRLAAAIRDLPAGDLQTRAVAN